MLWLKALHIITMVAWFAGLFYLPRLFVYHVEAEDKISKERFKIMERRLYKGIMWPAALLTLVFGIWILLDNPLYYLYQPWMHAKLLLVALLLVYHLSLGHYLTLLHRDIKPHSALFFRIWNEIPTVFLISIVFLVVVK
ncbi:MAG: hypothetical protein A3F18_01790 [Legionellales bacterium RIFCSPHIGHO2_12_FULL_37_14]|nr:MAG: hypothetical protein A3F18_01790 [Legionellales bacterium RIFCSPHIGHO2_12_FULL_37_14]